MLTSGNEMQPAVNIFLPPRRRSAESTDAQPTAMAKIRSGLSDPVKATVRLLFLPYSSRRRMSLVQFLVRELKSRRWSRFAAAVAFAKHSGNYVQFINALQTFARRGNHVELTFGANMFGPEAASTEYEAVESLLNSFQGIETARVYLYRERGRTFHPKVYLFDNERAALLVVGSSNWTDGGLRNNVEANLIVDLDLTDDGHRKMYQSARSYFDEYWQGKGVRA